MSVLYNIWFGSQCTVSKEIDSARALLCGRFEKTRTEELR